MLKLIGIRKNYQVGADVVQALKDFSIAFRRNEFVSILGPSGCGKTTLLNIIGGLDQYTSGDLIIEGKSTKQFKPKDWDAYRNAKVGFVFQNYYLIPHLTVGKNVEMALTLSGVKPKDRKEKVKAALEAVGLGDQLNKKPNQLSGGQMQRVSIARALVNDPEIILADEPTGALDSNTSVQIMDLLAEIAKTRLVIMVTHNGELAQQYSTRIVSLLDGEKVGDTNPYEGDPDPEVVLEAPASEAAAAAAVVAAPAKKNFFADIKEFFHNLRMRKHLKRDRSAMSYTTAINLSFSNLRTKKARTIITTIASSIGIIGVGLVLAISNGFSAYVDEVEKSALNAFPIMINETTYDQKAVMQLTNFVKVAQESSLEAHPKDGKVRVKEVTMGMGNSIEDMMKTLQKMVITNNLTQKYFDYIDDMDMGTVHYIYNLDMNLVANPYEGTYSFVNKGSVGWQQLLGGKDFIDKQYQLIAGRYPRDKFEVVIFVDRYNRLEKSVLELMGINVTRRIEEGQDITFEELLSTGKIKFAENDAYYAYNEAQGRFVSRTAKDVAESDKCHDISVVGIMRVKPGIEFEMMNTGIAYTQALVDFAFETAKTSAVVTEQLRLKEEARLKFEADKKFAEETGGKVPKDWQLKNVLTGRDFEPSADDLFKKLLGIEPPTAEQLCDKLLQKLGGLKTPVSAYIFPDDFKEKAQIKNYLDEYNRINKDQKVVYTDLADTATSMANEIVNIITIVLSCFAGISLVVSSVMIGIITYVSVVERTQEIGILRSIGARKLDIFNVFNAETTIIGFSSGMIGIIMTYILSVPINIIIKSLTGITANIAALLPHFAVLLVGISVFLTFIAGLVPANIAARKNPVLALRSE